MQYLGRDRKTSGIRIRYKLLQKSVAKTDAEISLEREDESPEVLRNILTGFPYGVWNKPIEHFARNRRPDEWFAFLSIDQTSDAWVAPVKLGLPANASGEEVAAKANKGDLYVPDLDHFAPVRGTRLAPLKLKEHPEKSSPGDPLFPSDQGTMRKVLDYTTRREIADAIAAYDQAHPVFADKVVRLEAGQRFGALRPDGTLVLISVFGTGDSKSLQFIPVGKIAIPAAANGAPSTTPVPGKHLPGATGAGSSPNLH